MLSILGTWVLILTKGNSGVGVEDGVCLSLQTHPSLSSILHWVPRGQLCGSQHTRSLTVWLLTRVSQDGASSEDQRVGRKKRLCVFLYSDPAALCTPGCWWSVHLFTWLVLRLWVASLVASPWAHYNLSSVSPNPAQIFINIPVSGVHSPFCPLGHWPYSLSTALSLRTRWSIYSPVSMVQNETKGQRKFLGVTT